MNEKSFLLLVGILTAAVLLTRGLPFLLFGRKGNTPPIITYLGKVLPAAMMGLLVVYCFKDADFQNLRALIPTLAASACVIGVHLWKRNTILSIALGTVLYMVLIRIF